MRVIAWLTVCPISEYALRVNFYHKMWFVSKSKLNVMHVASTIRCVCVSLESMRLAQLPQFMSA